ncbi:MAG: hypothetical protein AAF415_17685 [Pseudomonadota bacterium]
MLDSLAPIVATALLICIAASLGTYPVKKLIQIREAKRELNRGSSGYILTISGWIIIAIWLIATWFFATITGDWWATGDLDGAIERSARRLELILRLLVAIADD